MNVNLLNITINMLDVLLRLYLHNKINLEDLKKHSDVKISFIIDHIDHLNSSAEKNYAYDIMKQYHLIISATIKVDDI